jgi:hypothetical protein
LQVNHKPYAKLWLHDLATDPTEKTSPVATSRTETATLVGELR